VNLWRRARPAPAPAPAKARALFGYLAVEIVDGEVRTFGRIVYGRYLGPLAGARASMTMQRLSSPARWLTAKGIGPKLLGTLSITFADGTKHERVLLANAALDASKIEAEVARFNAAAQAAISG
jgi:hypothetical protein